MKKFKIISIIIFLIIKCIINAQPTHNIIYENKHLYGLTFQIGYKSSGYSIGEQLQEGMIIRGGVSFQLNKDI